MPSFTIFDPDVGDTVLPLLTNAGAPTNGTTWAGVAGIGALLLDSTNGVMYINTGTKVSPTWSAYASGGAAATFSTVTLGSVAAALSAAGTTRADATVLTKQVNSVTTVSASTTGVVLPASAIGLPIFLFNIHATNSFHVYGAGSDTVDGVVGTTGVVLGATKGAIFMPVAANTYVSMAAVKSA